MGFECRCSVARELRPFAAWSAIASRALGPLLRRFTGDVASRAEDKPLTLTTRSESEPRPITADVPRGTMRPGDREVAAGAAMVRRRGSSWRGQEPPPPPAAPVPPRRPTGASGRTVTGALCTLYPRPLSPRLRTGDPLPTTKPEHPIAHKCDWSMFHVEHLARGPAD
jgi:hypothetical protein